MIRVFLILIVILKIEPAFSQDYSGQYVGATHFYSINGNNKIYIISEGQNYLSGVYMVRIPYLNLRNVQNDSITDPNCSFWGSYGCVFKRDSATLIGKKIVSGNNQIKFFNDSNDSLIIKFNIPVGDTQTVFQNSGQRIIFKTIVKDSATVFGQNDSIIKFVISHEDNVGNSIGSSISEDTVVFSKSCGMIKGFSMDNFPYSFRKICLEGIREAIPPDIWLKMGGKLTASGYEKLVKSGKKVPGLVRDKFGMWKIKGKDGG